MQFTTGHEQAGLRNRPQHGRRSTARLGLVPREPTAQAPVVEQLVGCHINCRLRTLDRLRRRARKDNPGQGGADKPEGRKADFSAYWSLKVREFFSARRQYLESGQERKDVQPDVLRRLGEEIDKRREELKQLQPPRLEPRLTRDELEREAEATAMRITQPVEQALLGRQLPSDLPTDPVSVQWRQARRDAGAGNLVLAAVRAQQLLQALLMAPFALAVNAYRAWQELFKSQRYEMFLMSEGERIWFWRNRMENERWFWEVFAWDRLLFPILCTVAYEYVVPNHLVWAVVVPSVFIAWQTGTLPGPRNMEFWLIAYFGVYQKCWADVVHICTTLFCWA